VGVRAGRCGGRDRGGWRRGRRCGCTSRFVALGCRMRRSRFGSWLAGSGFIGVMSARRWRRRCHRRARSWCVRRRRWTRSSRSLMAGWRRMARRRGSSGTRPVGFGSDSWSSTTRGSASQRCGVTSRRSALVRDCRWRRSRSPRPICWAQRPKSISGRSACISLACCVRCRCS
ncbi:MAG: hypothetical protein FD127_4468, partial [Acidimicrobiaceae bacterium]